MHYSQRPRCAQEVLGFDWGIYDALVHLGRKSSILEWSFETRYLCLNSVLQFDGSRFGAFWEDVSGRIGDRILRIMFETDSQAAPPRFG